MPATSVLFFRERDGACPVVGWLRELRRTDRAGFAKCAARIQLLAAAGHELRRPVADYLRDGIYELRARHGHVQYRILYFFHGRNVAVLAHAIVKPDAQVPALDIARARNRKDLFVRDPNAHTYREDLDHDAD